MAQDPVVVEARRTSTARPWWRWILWALGLVAFLAIIFLIVIPFISGLAGGRTASQLASETSRTSQGVGAAAKPETTTVTKTDGSGTTLTTASTAPAAAATPAPASTNDPALAAVLKDLTASVKANTDANRTNTETIVSKLDTIGKQPAATTGTTGTTGAVALPSTGGTTATTGTTGGTNLIPNGGTTTTSGGSAATLLPPDNATNNAACRADKVATWSENEGRQRFRKEVNGGGFTHHEHYAQPGTRTVSFIFGTLSQTQAPSILWGYGSQWEWPSDCANVDYIADVTKYAKARGPDKKVGHSGLAFDFRSNPARLVTNVFGLGLAEINDVLVQNGLPFKVDGNGVVSANNLGDRFNATTNIGAGAQGGGTTPNNSLPAGSSGNVTPPGSSSTAAGQSPGKLEVSTRTPTVGKPWLLNTESWRVATLWTNEPGKDQTERKVLLTPSDNLSVLAGGTLYDFGSDENSARAKYDSVQMPVGNLGQYK